MIRTDLHFGTPIYIVEKPEWLEKTIYDTNSYIDYAIKRDEDEIKKLPNYNTKQDHGFVYHSETLMNDNKFDDIKKYINDTSKEILDLWGFDLTQYSMFFTELWVQEFSKSGGGNHNTHIHWDNHISGFYFLKCSEKTSYPVFYDPRPGAMMTKLQQKDNTKITLGSDAINYRPKPGTMMFFPSYLDHQFVVDDGVEPFRFIHFNLQAVRNSILNLSKGNKNG